MATATWPLREDFGAGDVVPRAEGLVGGHPSRRPGEGSDVAGVRPFVVGDRLRRVNWRVTGRTGTLHVTSTYADRDTEVLLCLDSRQDLGRSPDSSLDTGVRAAAAVAEHYLRAGDRVGLIDLGQRYRVVPARAGRGHLVRLLDVLLDARSADDGARAAPAAGELAGHIGADALVVLLSPLAADTSLRDRRRAGAGRPVGGRDRHAAGRRCARTRAASTPSWRSGCGGCAGTPTCTGWPSWGCRSCAGRAPAASTSCCGTSGGRRGRLGWPGEAPGARPSDRPGRRCCCG